MTRKPKKRSGLNRVDTSIVKKIKLFLVTDLNFYACFLCFYEFILSSFAQFFFVSGYFREFSSEQGIEPLGNKILKALPCQSMPLINKHDIFQIFHNSFFLNLCYHVISSAPTYLPVCCKTQRFGRLIKLQTHGHMAELLLF